MTPPQPLPITIENPSPSIEEGRFAAKRLVGDRVRVGADILADTDQPICARVLFRGPGAGDWRSVPLRYDEAADRYRGEFTVDRIGRWQWTLEAQPADAPEAVARLERGREIQVERERAGVGAWFEIESQPTGVARLEGRLAELADQGFDVIQLAHPAPGAQPVREGADFERLVQSARARGLELAIEHSFGTERTAEFWGDDRLAGWTRRLAGLRGWLDRGVRALVLSAAETPPLAFFEWLVPELQQAQPDVILVAKAAARPKRLKRLARLGFSQCHTYFPWKTGWWEIREHLGELTRDSAEFLRPQLFANPADVSSSYLDAGGAAALRVRLLLAATLAPAWGVRGPLDADTASLAGRLNRIRRENDALRELGNLEFLTSDDPEILWYRKSAPANELLIAVNLDPRRARETTVEVPLADLGLASAEPFLVSDLLDGARYRWQGARNYVRLDPAERAGHVLRLARPGEAELGPGRRERGAYTSAPVRGRFLAPREVRG